MKTLIGISGKKQAGKDTVARIISYLAAYDEMDFPNETRYAYVIKNLANDVPLFTPFKTTRFADSLKQVAGCILNVEPELFESNSFKQEVNRIGISDVLGHSYTNRELLQLIGTEVGRNIDKDIWIKTTFSDWTEESKWIIADVRFPNEAESIKQRGGMVIRINRPLDNQDEHPSEVALDDYDQFDVTINNDGSITDLIDKVTAIYDALIK